MMQDAIDSWIFVNFCLCLLLGGLMVWNARQHIFHRPTLSRLWFGYMFLWLAARGAIRFLYRNFDVHGFFGKDGGAQLLIEMGFGIALGMLLYRAFTKTLIK